jgi:hypothetical protein
MRHVRILSIGPALVIAFRAMLSAPSPNSRAEPRNSWFASLDSRAEPQISPNLSPRQGIE